MLLHSGHVPVNVDGYEMTHKDETRRVSAVRRNVRAVSSPALSDTDATC